MSAVFLKALSYALALKADIVTVVACPLYPRKQTCVVQLGMSALCQ